LLACPDRETTAPAPCDRPAFRSTALNIAEGNHSSGGHRLARFSTAAGSNNEARTALRVAVAWGYVCADQVQPGDELLDRVGAMLYRLAPRR
jgi:four helix bundle protein